MLFIRKTGVHVSYEAMALGRSCCGVLGQCGARAASGRHGLRVKDSWVIFLFEQFASMDQASPSRFTHLRGKLGILCARMTGMRATTEQHVKTWDTSEYVPLGGTQCHHNDTDDRQTISPALCMCQALDAAVTLQKLILQPEGSLITPKLST